VDPLLIIGFESGAISMFKIVLALNDEKQKVLKTVKLFSAQKLIQDLKVKHVLSLCVTHMSSEASDFKLAIGYYGNLMQTIEFTTGYEQDSYTMVDQHITD
jgi:hypothetical protein